MLPPPCFVDCGSPLITSLTKSALALLKERLYVSAETSLPETTNWKFAQVAGVVPVDTVVTSKLPAPLEPRDGTKSAIDLDAWAELCATNSSESALYPPSPKTLTIVTTPALLKYCYTAYGV